MRGILIMKGHVDSDELSCGQVLKSLDGSLRSACSYVLSCLK